jgi:hypothetical protein
MGQLLAATMREDVEEVWVRLTSTQHVLSLDEIYDAYGWAIQFQKRVAISTLLERHGASREGLQQRRKPEKVRRAASYMDSVFKVSPPFQGVSRDITYAVSVSRRAQVLGWLVRVCDAFGLDSKLMVDTALRLDRYYAARGSGRRCQSAVAECELHSLTLAALCSEMRLAKLTTMHEILERLGQGQVSLQDILKTEAEMFVQTGYFVKVTTTMTFLKDMVHHIRGGFLKLLGGFNHLESISSFLVDLALFDVDLAYRYPKPVLAAAALGCALLCVGAKAVGARGLGDGGEAACVSPGTSKGDSDAKEGERELTTGLHEVIVSFLVNRCPEQVDNFGTPYETRLRECQNSLLQFWRECERSSSYLSVCYEHLCGKYARTFGKFHRVALLSPRTAPPGSSGAATGGTPANFVGSPGAGMAGGTLVLEGGLCRFQEQYGCPVQPCGFLV